MTGNDGSEAVSADADDADDAMDDDAEDDAMDDDAVMLGPSTDGLVSDGVAGVEGVAGVGGVVMYELGVEAAPAWRESVNWRLQPRHTRTGLGPHSATTSVYLEHALQKMRPHWRQ